MVGSIDPRCETVRGTHWPKPGRVVVWSSRRGNHLGQRFKPTASKGRTYGCKRSDQTVKKLLWHGGRPHMGPRFRGDDKWLSHCAPPPALTIEVIQSASLPRSRKPHVVSNLSARPDRRSRDARDRGREACDGGCGHSLQGPHRC